MEREKTSQVKQVEKHLLEHGSITSWEAIGLYGATRLSGIIFTLREQGMNIETEMIKSVNRYGNAVSFAKYVYKESENNGKN